MEMLRAEGVRYIFGNPGTSESAIMSSLLDYPDIKYVLVTQEGVAMGMADGYSSATAAPPWSICTLRPASPTESVCCTMQWTAGFPWC